MVLVFQFMQLNTVNDNKITNNSVGILVAYNNAVIVLERNNDI